MACQSLTSPNWFSHALAAINSSKSCAVRCVALLTCRSPREHCYAGIRTLSRWAASGPARVTFQRLEGATLGGGKPWNALGRIGVALGAMASGQLNGMPRDTVLAGLGTRGPVALLDRVGWAGPQQVWPE